MRKVKTMANIVQGCARVAQGKDPEGLLQASNGLRAWRQTGAVILVPTFLSMLAEAYGLFEQSDAGLMAIAEAIGVTDTTNESWWAAEIHRLNAELLMQNAAAEMDVIEGSLVRALGIARHQQARSLELRVAMSLGHLWHQQGRRVDACRVVADIYNWFSEGQNTGDLKKARALLQEWR